MIKPVTLWNFIHECSIADAEFIGRICLSLAGQSIEFNHKEELILKMIKKDNTDMDERIAAKRASDRERKKKWRNAEGRGRTSKDAEGAEDAEEKETKQPKARYIVPEEEPSAPPQQPKTLMTETPSVARKSVDVWKLSEDEIRYGTLSAKAILLCAFGNGGWAKAVAQVGDAAVRELFLIFRSEIEVGESVNDPAAAFTQRLKNDLHVDFSLSYEESVKRGREIESNLTL